MKKLCRLAWVSLSLPLFLSNTFVSQEKILQKGYYLVVAAYASRAEDYALRYSEELNKNGLHAKYGFDEKRKFFYVYLETYNSYDYSINEMLKVRNEGKFDRAWVRIIKEESAVEENSTTSTVDNTEPKKIKTETPKQQQSPQPSQEVKKETKEVVAEVTQKEEPKNVVTEVVSNPPAQPVYEPQTLKNTPVFLSLYNATNNLVLDGEVEVVDAVNSKLIKKVKGNDYLALPNPGNGSGGLLLISNVFGFRKEEHQINYKNTEADTLKPYVALVGNFYMINFGLTKIHKGDISTLYNVYFYNDAAIMLPTSQYQLNSLLTLLKENPTYKIMLHGHTNGGGGGKIIYMGPGKNFFAITKDVVQGSGSAKELSEARAEVIKKWLVSQGVSGERIDVRGWGGSRMIHDKNSAHARKNIRVDVEVVDE